MLYRRALRLGDVSVNPCANLDLPAVRGRRERIASPDEAAALLAALEPRERAIYATAFYAGLRLGELRALRWDDLDLAVGTIRIERALDHKGETIAPKSRAGRRSVPMVAVLRDHLLDWKLRGGGEGYAFGVQGRPFAQSSVHSRARRAWAKLGLQPIGLHEARHVFASVLIAAGVNAKAISTYLGHSSIAITYDLYGHLMPGSEAEARGLVDAYLERASTRARLAQVEH